MSAIWKSIVRLLSWLLLCGPAATAGDWPQILGPSRDGHANDERLADDWSNQKPMLQWQTPIGAGYAGPAVVGRQVLVFHRTGDRETLVSLTTDRGEVTWDVSWPATYRSNIDPDSGPRCVPIVYDNRVFVFGADGDLHAVRLKTGEHLWSRALARDYKASRGYFGAGSTPLVVQNRLLVNVGGPDGAGIVALDPATGKTIWSALDDEASYSSPIPWEVGNSTHAIFVTRLNAVGVDVETGREIFRVPFGVRGPTVNAATPLLISPRRLFLTASYGIGARLIEIDRPETRIVWSGPETLSSQYPTPIYSEGWLFGVHGREDGPPASYRCVEAKSGQVRWEKPEMGMAHSILADSKLVVLRTGGELLLVSPTPEQFLVLGRQRVSTAITRALPALAAGRLYLRDTAGTMACWKLPQ